MDGKREEAGNLKRELDCYQARERLTNYTCSDRGPEAWQTRETGQKSNTDWSSHELVLQYRVTTQNALRLDRFKAKYNK